MSFVMSALLYNPLEAMLLILFVKYIGNVNIPIDRKFICHCYLLGYGNLLTQYISKYFPLGYGLIYNIFVSIVLMTILLYLYSHSIMKLKFRVKFCLLSCIFNFITICFGLYILDIMNITEVMLYFNYDSICNEFINNIIIKILQFGLLLIIYYGVLLYDKKNFKKNGFKRL